MSLARFSQECPGLASSITRLYGSEVASQIAQDYCLAADLGGNVEPALTREEGVSFNPRIARIVSLVIQDCEAVSPAMVRVAVYSSVSSEHVESLPSDIVSYVKGVNSGSPDSSSWMLGVSLARVLDRVRHLHMISVAHEQREALLKEVVSSPLLLPNSGVPERLRAKVLHAVDLQSRRLSEDRERIKT